MAAHKGRAMFTIRDARPDDANDLARVFLEGWRTETQTVLPEAVRAARPEDVSARNWLRTLRELEADPRDPRFILVAEDAAGVVAGLAMAQPERTGETPFAAEINALYVDDAHRRQGCGRALVAAAAARLASAGSTSLLIRVLVENAPGRRFYEALGGEPAAGRMVEDEGYQLEETAYGWPDTRTLLRADGG